MSNTLLSPLHRSACPTTISRRQQPHSADGTLSLDLGRQNPDPSARRHGVHGTHANQNHRPRAVEDFVNLLLSEKGMTTFERAGFYRFKELRIAGDESAAPLAIRSLIKAQC